LILIKTATPKALTNCMMTYVFRTIGETFTRSPALDLEKAHGDSSKVFIFINYLLIIKYDLFIVY
jgi:hypothetical protein